MSNEKLQDVKADFGNQHERPRHLQKHFNNEVSKELSWQEVDRLKKTYIGLWLDSFIWRREWRVPMYVCLSQVSHGDGTVISDVGETPWRRCGANGTNNKYKWNLQWMQMGFIVSTRVLIHGGNNSCYRLKLG